MNIKKLVAAVAVFAAAGSVFAGDLMPFSELDNFKSSKTRADVRAEVVRDHADIALAHGDIGAVEQPAAVTKSTRTRLAVRKEAIESAHNTNTHGDIGS